MNVRFNIISCGAVNQTSTQVPSCCEWHPLLPLFGIANPNSGTVAVYDDQGNKDKRANGLSRSSGCVAMAWHPEKAILATGWKDGALVVYNQDSEKKKVSEISGSKNVHNRPYTKIAFSPDGSRIISCDEGNNIAIWGVNSKGKVELMQHYKSQDPIEHIQFKQMNAPIKQAGDVVEGEYVFFLATTTGIGYVANDLGNLKVAFNLKCRLAAFLHYEEKSSFVALTFQSLLVVFNVTEELKITRKMTTKISVSTGGVTDDLKCIWIGRGIIATCSNETMIRVWSLDTDDLYTLAPQEDVKNPFVQMAFNPRKSVLAAVTSEGVLYCWQYVGSPSDPKGKDDWEQYAKLATEDEVFYLKWGPGENLLSYCSPKASYVLHETVLKKTMFGNIVAVQKGNKLLSLEAIRNFDTILELKSGLKIRDIALTENFVAVSNGKEIEIFQISEGLSSFRSRPSIKVPHTCMAIHKEGALICRENRFEIYSFDGVTKKQTKTFGSAAGEPVSIDVHKDFIVIGTSSGHLKLFQLTGRNARESDVPLQLFDSKDRVISSVKANCDGTKVSVLSKQVHGNQILQPSTILSVVNIHTLKVDEYNFQDHGRYPISHHWDQVEPKLLSVEAKRFTQGTSPNQSDARIEVFTLFATPENGVLVQDNFAMDRDYGGLVGTGVPSLFFVVKDVDVGPKESVIKRKSLRDFEGINVQDSHTQDALLKFSYFLTVGNMEEAYKAVKTIKDVNVWQNMAQMCVKTQKMDVAEICLSNMKDARASKALREAKKEPELEAQIAMLAIQLGMLPEAEKLYKQCKRYDLLTKLLTAQGKWEDAIELCKLHDRIHLKTIHYQYARYLEGVGDFGTAVEHYKLSKNHKYEVPRMFFDAGRIGDLQRFILGANDNDLYRWWAQYSEGNGDYDSAFKFYIKAKDYYALVRLNCFMEQYETAAQIVDNSGDRASAFHLAKQFEMKKKFDEAMKYFKVANRYRDAIRVAREKDLPQEVMNIAIQSPSSIKLEAAQYFEEKGMMDKAVTLYQKGGYLSRAIEICFKHERLDLLMDIADGLNQKSDPNLLLRCAEFFVKHRKYGKAVSMYANAGKIEQALDLCQRHHIVLSDEIGNQIIALVSKKDPKQDPKQRKESLIHIARVAREQGNYNLAVKLYVKAGERMTAMKALIESGETDKIVYFASLSRSKAMFKLAANYLVTVDWKQDPSIQESILSFYKKSKCYEELSRFHEQRCNYQIDEFRAYTRALELLQEALNVGKLTPMRTKELQQKIYLMKKFIGARNLVKSDPDQMVQLCGQLLNEVIHPQDVPRRGDIFALLVEFYFSQGDHRKAHMYMEKLKEEDIQVDYYVDKKMRGQIYQALGMKIEDEEPQEVEDEMYDPNAMQEDGDYIEEEEEEVYEEVL